MKQFPFLLSCLLLFPLLLSSQVMVDMFPDSVPMANREDLLKFEQILSFQNGIQGTYFTEIDPYTSANGVGRGRNWFPRSTRPLTACGKVYDFHVFNARKFWLFEPERDLVVEYALNPAFQHLNLAFDYNIKSELTTDPALFDHPWLLPGQAQAPNSSTPYCACGPYVEDGNHGDLNQQGNRVRRLEIHPAQVAWWEIENTHYLLAAKDDSRRFSEQGDFNRYGPGRNLPDDFQPWVPNLLFAKFYFAFVVYPPPPQLGAGLPPPALLTIESNTSKGAEKDVNSDFSHTLNWNSIPIITVQTGGADLQVRFVEVRQRPDGAVQGYVSIATALAGKGAYHLLSARWNQMEWPADEGAACRQYALQVENRQAALARNRERIQDIEKNIIHWKGKEKQHAQRYLDELKTEIPQMEQQIAEAQSLLKKCKG